MREIGEEFTAHALQTRKLGDVEEDADGQGIVQRRDIQLIAAAVDLGHLDARLDGCVLVERLAKCLVDQRVARRRDQAKRRRREAQVRSRIAGGQLDDARRRVVVEDDAQVAVNDQHAFAHGRQHAGQQMIGLFAHPCLSLNLSKRRAVARQRIARDNIGQRRDHDHRDDVRDDDRHAREHQRLDRLVDDE